ncbi:MAG: transketolase [Candidatus Marinimicrobia bacterium]|nr:transketolase [Candidatus Neomarinimicrobiota bacterium]
MTDGLLMNQMRGLIMDTVRRANSGHTGGPLSSLDFAMLLYRDVLRYDPDDPTWFNRDRFVLSAGHESALLYTLLYMIGYLELDDLQNFRQLHSRTPGHPEVDLTPGVECTSGPLGQGIAMAVGMAVAEEMLRARLGEDIVNHDTYCLCGDGDLQEPVTLGACALAGHWRLGRLIMYYDRNRVQISGGTERADSTQVDQLFNSFGWHVLTIDGHDHDAIGDALAQARSQIDQPTLIIGDTIMAHGTAGMEGMAATHGSPLPPEEIAATKEKLGLDPEATFQVTQEAITELRRRQPGLRDKAAAWRDHLKKRRGEQEFDDRWRSFFEPLDAAQLPWPRFEPGASIATRQAFGQVLDAVAGQLPGLVGGSADLEPSNNTANFAKRYGDFGAQHRAGRSLAYGVREFPMGAINNGIALHGGLRPFGATFLVFTDYERPALRLRALQQLPAIGVYTHDSIFLGEDGPTHQPVEHIMALRLIPGMQVYRPGDAVETALVLEQILGSDRPASLLLTRQGLPVLPKEYHRRAREGVPRGGYVLKEATGEPEVTIFACGSEVALALEVDGLLAGIDIKIVSLPCWELFFEQPEDYREAVLASPAGLRVSLEAGATLGWERFTGRRGLNIGVDRFGWSAPGKEVAAAAGFQAEQVAKRIKAALAESDARGTASG